MAGEHTLVELRLKVTPQLNIPTLPNQRLLKKNQLPSSNTLHVMRYSPDKILKVKVTTAK